MAHWRLKEKSRLVNVIGCLIAFSLMFGCVSKTNHQEASNSPATQSASVKTAEATTRMIDNVTVVQKDNNTIEILIKGNQKLVYTSIKQSFPFGIAIYLPETKINENIHTDVSGVQDIEKISVLYADSKKSTAKIEILLNDDLDYSDSLSSNENDLLFILSKKTDTTGSQSEIVTQNLQPSSGSGAAINSAASLSPVIIPDTTATLSDIKFTTDQDGKSDVYIKTSHPVNYTITKGKEKQLFLNLEKTITPKHHQRPLITTYFKSAVEEILPVQANTGLSRVEINLRDDLVPYHIIQTQEGIFLSFEPTSIQPPVFTKARKKIGSEEPDQTGTDIESQKAEMQSLTDELFGPPKVYTGEKIKLDFYETDIKNVFRILRTVSGYNFAIDKDVSGKVTMTLDNPVPWDQVLDLILKMNDLGKIQEGNVLRIATNSTIKNENLARQEIINARKKELEQKKSLEPLVTEYIPINYSDAGKEIQPHIAKILTEKRGMLSVDSRTNTLIMTDTKEKIDQAKEIIYRLDKVTPQIMIEAKVVEVSDDFSRKLGIGLRINRGQTPLPNNNPDFEIAMNGSPGSDSSISFGKFNLYRIFGSTVSWLNAELNASETRGDAKIISSPRILTLDNKKARIKQGVEIGYTELDENGSPSTKFKNADLMLEVTPHVTPDKRISMSIHLTKDDLAGFFNGVPYISTNEADTELLINNEDTIIIGGVIKKTLTKSKSGTPYLMDVPVLGRLLRTDSNDDKRNELMIFLTPQIVQLEQKAITGTSIPVN